MMNSSYLSEDTYIGHCMRFYFQLQILRIARFFREAGVNPAVGGVLTGVLFLGISLLIFEKLDSAVYVYVGLAILLLSPLNSRTRIEFLKGIFSQNTFRLIRLFENVTIAIPFGLVLTLQGEYVFSVLLLFLSALMSFFSFGSPVSLVIPTQFGKQPFEFTRGFRQMLWAFILVYILATISVIVGNYNLGVFSLILIYLISLSFYNKPEPLYFVWVHSCSTKAFLKRKILIAVKYVTFLAVPIAIALVLFNPSNVLIIVAVLVIGPLYTVLSLLAKYAYYPSEINIIPALSIALSIVIPPLVLFAIPFFYRQSLNNLRPVLL